jgi:hypothetical protein
VADKHDYGTYRLSKEQFGETLCILLNERVCGVV